MSSNRPDSRPVRPENWEQMTREEKRQHRLNEYLSTEGKKFVSPEAEKAYKVRAQRMVDVLNIQEPDRVPVSLPVGSLPLQMQGLGAYSGMYEQEKALDAYMKFNEQYSEELDQFAMPMLNSGQALDILDYKIYSWPGHDLPKDASGWQYIEGEYMYPEEYDDLILDPTDFWLRTYLPRVIGAFEPFRMFQPFTNITENVHVGQILGPLSTPPVQHMLETMLSAGKAHQKVTQAMSKYAGAGQANGFPVMGSIFFKAPFDTLSDTLRSTKGIIEDMFRRPDKLLKALDVIADVTIHTVLNAPNIDTAVMAGAPLHKGADGWMSQKQFDTFYWPSLKKVMDAFIQEGLIQRLFAEGGYESRLDSINEFPKGTVLWYFDRTDMFKAKKALGDKCCIQGNVPSALTITGTPAEVKEYCCKLIEGCAPGGGFILSAGAVGNEAKLENLRAMMEAAKEYGTY